LAIKGTALDARLQYELLMDPTLNHDLTGDEFRTFMRLLVWSVSLVSDGAFEADRARMLAERDVIDRLTQVGVLDYDAESGWHRIAPAYWDWQSSKAELDKLSARREADKLRKRKQQDDEKPRFEPEQPF
jgi:hypothetical protein